MKNMKTAAGMYVWQEFSAWEWEQLYLRRMETAIIP